MEYQCTTFKLSRYISIKENQSINELDLNKVFIIGNGAVDGGWDIVFKAFKTFSWTNKIFDSKIFRNIKKDNLLIALTIIAFNEKLFRNNFILKNNLRNESITVLREINEFKEHLCLLFDKSLSEGTLKVKRYIYELINKECFSDYYHRYGIITLNWDQLFWNDLDNFPNLIQLHGRTKYPNSLVFPTDLTVDNCIIKKLSQDIGIDEPLIVLNEIDDEVKNSHNAAIHWLSQANEINFIGLGLNHYDSELSSILFAIDMSNKLIRLYDIDKNKLTILSDILSVESKDIEFILAKNDAV